MIKANERSFDILNKLMRSSVWYIGGFEVIYSIIDFVSFFTINKKIARPEYWNKQTSPHFSELGATGLKYLEQALFELKDIFLMYTVLTDTNGKYKDTCSWQYPPRNSWFIKKEDVLKNVNTETIQQKLIANSEN